MENDKIKRKLKKIKNKMNSQISKMSNFYINEATQIGRCGYTRGQTDIIALYNFVEELENIIKDIEK